MRPLLFHDVFYQKIDTLPSLGNYLGTYGILNTEKIYNSLTVLLL